MNNGTLKRIFVFLIVIFVSSVLSGLHYYHNKIQLSDLSLVELDKSFGGKSYPVIGIPDSPIYVSNTIVQKLFDQVSPKTTIYLSNLSGKNNLKMLEQFSTWCMKDILCDQNKLSDVKDKFYNLNGLFTDLSIFSYLVSHIDKNLCYLKHPYTYVIQGDKFYTKTDEGIIVHRYTQKNGAVEPITVPSEMSSSIKRLLEKQFKSGESTYTVYEDCKIKS